MSTLLLSAALGLGVMCPSLSAAAMTQVHASASVSREEVRAAVRAHRAAEQEQIQRDEAMIGRRLTPAERAQLREQLRNEWAMRAAAAQHEAEAAQPPQRKGSWWLRWPWRGDR